MFRRAATILLPLALIFSFTAYAIAAATPWSPLSGGHKGRYSWAVGLGSSAGASFSRKAPVPCLRVAITIRHGRFSRGRDIFRDCALAPTTLRRLGPPLLAGGSQLGPTDSAGMTVYGIVTPAAVRRVHLAFADGSEATASLWPVDQPSAPVAGIGNLRSAVLALPGAHCIERLVEQSAAGRTLWEGAPDGHSCRSG
jgi:hypothetical protein